MIKVNSSQFNHIYNNRIHFPYSIALLAGYVKTQKNIHKHFRFEKTFVFRDNLDSNIEQCKDTDILLCSCYVWNWQITTRFAKEVKKNKSRMYYNIWRTSNSKPHRRFFQKISIC